MKATDERLAELERQMACIARYYTDPQYSYGEFHRDLTTPPPKPRPVIEVALVNGTDGSFVITCGGHRWSSSRWASGGGFWYSERDARAIAAALEAAGNYPGEYR